MNSVNSIIYKNLIVLFVAVFAAIACENKSALPIKHSQFIKIKDGKSDTAYIYFKNPVESDTSLQKNVASDSIEVDTSHNHLQETTRKLDMRYFRKSFNLHRRSYITFNNVTSLSTAILERMG